MDSQEVRDELAGPPESPAVRLEDRKGRFIRPCPGTPRHVCCGYRIIDIAHGCHLGCSYCVLSHYFKGGETVIFRNWRKLFGELERFLERRKGLHRFGTGEFTDSLLFEEFRLLYRELIPFFSRSDGAVLELKTKTANVGPLLEIGDHANVIAAWSLNSERVSLREEGRAPRMAQRLEAARRVQEEGYALAFHFDPIVLHEGWREGYERTVDALFREIHPRSVAYISLGALRFPHGMGETAMRGVADYLAGEFVKGNDNKMRYFRPLRVAAYRFLVSLLEKHVGRDILYLCMESPTVWEDVFRIRGMTTQRLSARLDDACGKIFGRM
jgi:spore photoproduct lyase